MSTSKRGFTLIELLIVVAIIAILAVIAVPNFLEAQVRSKVSRVKADMRSIKTAVEAYRADHNDYPILRGYIGAGQVNRGGIHAAVDLTTPVAYMTSVNLPDPFAPPMPPNEYGDIYPEGIFRDWMAVPYSIGYVHVNLARAEANSSPIASPQYVLLSLGPDYIRGPHPNGGEWGYGSYAWVEGGPNATQNYAAWEYDPTNGARSHGDILMWQ